MKLPIAPGATVGYMKGNKPSEAAAVAATAAEEASADAEVDDPDKLPKLNGDIILLFPLSAG